MIRNNDLKVVFCWGIRILPPITIIMMQDYSQALITGSARRAYPVESVSKMEYVLSVTSFEKYMGCICSTGPFEFRWLKRYICNPSHLHHQIGRIHLSNCCHIFRGCVPKMVVPSYFVVCYTYTPRTLGLVSIIDEQSIVCANDRVHYGLSTVCAHYTHYHIHLKAINSYNACQVYTTECLSKIISIVPIVRYSTYGVICLQLSKLSDDDRENMFSIILTS